MDMARPKAGEKTPLSRQRILDAALRIVDRDGLEALSMRKIGAELQVEAMSLYRYVAKKEAVLDGIVELLLQELELPALPPDQWEEYLYQVAYEFRQMLQRHPAVLPIVATRPVNTAGSLAPMEHLLSTLRKAGFAPLEAVYTVNSLVGFVIGHAFLDFGTLQGVEPGTSDLKNLALEDFPAVREMATALEARRSEDEFEYGLRRLLAGTRLMQKTK